MGVRVSKRVGITYGSEKQKEGPTEPHTKKKATKEVVEEREEKESTCDHMIFLNLTPPPCASPPPHLLSFL